ncbi:MAG: sigma 54-interacting transcriptional regulator [Hydrogenovibrio sp.]|uniref:sigma-54 interaction domain-containing protein n=1 Tax=Hydrogenovibrio sp. TaxID=2065821 RepID=UPI0028707F07|nr:sigma 54-interacting transcriptional regulator [Hydrogenovibrio sp.]MDR9498201.1 sigma 54-interacting transcriptional regulator [Hydrogenovibrio sp.]
MQNQESLDIANQSEYLVIQSAAEQIENSFAPDQAIHTILSLISRQMGLNRGRVLLQESATGFLYTAYSYGLTPEEVRQGRFGASEGISGRVMHTGAPVIIPDIDQEDDYLFRTVDRATLPQEPVAFLATPIVRNKAVVGVLAINRLANRPRAFDKDLGMLKLISLFISEILAVHAMIQTQTQVLQEENEQLRAQAISQGSQYGIIGRSPALRSALSKAERAIHTPVTVLLKGESGTGKERFSRMLHLASDRQDAPFIAINCAAIPQELLESELFGHEKGAFTGATQMKQGKIELANHGTLFLDEIGDLDFGLQAKLLRVLEERSVTRVGSTRSIQVDTRIIVASHKDLHHAVNQGTFRLDLFYRLNVFPIELPPLRVRDGDIRLLARHFLNQANQEYQASAIFDPTAIHFLESYSWPGNIRQLENVVKRAVLLAENGRLISASLIEQIIQEESGIELMNAPAKETLSGPTAPADSAMSTAFSGPNEMEAYAADEDPNKRPYWRVSDAETDQLKQALALSHGNKTRAALRLNMTPRQFNYRLKKLGIA